MVVVDLLHTIEIFFKLEAHELQQLTAAGVATDVLLDLAVGKLELTILLLTRVVDYVLQDQLQ